MTPQAFNRGTQFGAAGSSRSQYVTVEGGRDSSTNYAIDGVYVRSLRFNNLSLNPPLDAVQEVAILRNSFTTEYGQGQSVVSMVTKSGSNSISGSAYTYRRDDIVQQRQLLRAEAGRQDTGRLHARRARDQEQVLRVRRVRGASHHGRPDAARQRAEPGAPERRLLQPLHRDQGSAHGPAVSRQHHPVEPLLELREDAAAHRSGSERRRLEQLQGDQARSTTTRIRRTSGSIRC